MNLFLLVVVSSLQCLTVDTVR